MERIGVPRPTCFLSLICIFAGIANIAPAQETGKRYRGILAYGYEAHSFLSCSSQEIFRIEATNAVLKDLELQFRKTKTGEYGSVYAEIEGLAGSTSDSRQMKLRRILAMRKRGDDDCGVRSTAPSLFIADRGVICNSRARICYDASGPSIRSTRVFFGVIAAESLLDKLKKSDPVNPTLIRVAKKVECQTDSRECLIEGKRNDELSAGMFPGTFVNGREELPAGVEGHVWAWYHTLLEDGKRIAPSNREAYTIRFDSDHMLRVRMDCKRADGAYSSEAGLRLEITQATEASCGPESLEEQYLSALGRVDGLSMRGGNLYLRLESDSGIMKFVKITAKAAQ